MQVDLLRLGRELSRHTQEGAPWRARDALDVVAMLDTTVWASLLGLLDECPVILASMMVTLEREEVEGRCVEVGPREGWLRVEKGGQVDQAAALG